VCGVWCVVCGVGFKLALSRRGALRPHAWVADSGLRGYGVWSRVYGSRFQGEWFMGRVAGVCGELCSILGLQGISGCRV